MTQKRPSSRRPSSLALDRFSISLTRAPPASIQELLARAKSMGLSPTAGSKQAKQIGIRFHGGKPSNRSPSEITEKRNNLSRLLELFPGYIPYFKRWIKTRLPKGLPFEDAFDSCLDHAIRGIPRFDPKKTGGISVKAWIINAWKRGLQHALRQNRRRNRVKQLPDRTDFLPRRTIVLKGSKISPPEHSLNLFERNQGILNAILALPSRERMILEYRFGLNGQEPHTLQQTAKKVDLSKGRVQQLEKEILQNLKNRITI